MSSVTSENSPPTDADRGGQSSMPSEQPDQPSQPQASRAEGASDDRTARARIHDAALKLFGELGFRATTMRKIAKEAGVSAALVVHHYGSKQGLRNEIDERLADKVREGEFEQMAGGGPMTPSEYREMMAEYEHVIPYLKRTLIANDELGRNLFDRMYSDAVEYMQVGVDSGVLRPSDHPEDRVAALLAISYGVMLLDEHLHRVMGLDDDEDAIDRLVPVLMELYTNGLFADDSALQAWRSESEHVAGIADPDPPSDGGDPS